MVKRLKPVRTVAPANPLLSVAEAKSHLRVDHSDDDTYIADLVLAAQGWLDGFGGVLGRALINQTWQEQLAGFAPRIPLLVGPVQSIINITYFDADETEQTLSTDVYRLLGGGRDYLVEKSGQVWPSTYARDDAVTITYVAGYGAAANAVPAQIRQAARFLVGHWYEHREAAVSGPMTAMPLAVQSMIRPFRATWDFY